jgi:hypothetical protein
MGEDERKERPYHKDERKQRRVKRKCFLRGVLNPVNERGFVHGKEYLSLTNGDHYYSCASRTVIGVGFMAHSNLSTGARDGRRTSVQDLVKDSESHLEDMDTSR